MAKKVKVKSGDTLTAIAKANGVSLNALLQANPQITDPKLIRPGQVVNIPDIKETVQEQNKGKQMSVETARRAPGVGGPLVDDGGNPVVDAAAGLKSGSNIPALGNTSQSASTLYPDLKQDTFDPKALAARFSIAGSIINSDTGLQKVLNDILAQKITDPDLQLAMLKETDWFKKNTDDWRKYQFYKESNPATFQADLKSNAEAFVRKYYAMGVTLDPNTAIKLAEQAMMKSATVNGNIVNYNENYFNQLMANSIDFSNKRTLPNGKIVYDLGGKVETLASSLYKVAWDYGYPATVSNAGFSKWLEGNVRGLIAGTVNPEDVDNELQSRAKSMYPGLTDQLNRGLSLREAADPWITALANEWEEDPRFLDLNDDFLYRILNQQDEKGNIAPMNLYQAKTMARRSPKWQYTSRAKEEYTNIGQKILQDFGFLG
jgi:LysM repeat protein